MLPKPNDVAAVNLTCFGPGAAQVSLEAFRHLLEHATPIPLDPKDGWSYAPWYHGSILWTDTRWSCDLFLGGRGRLTSPSGVHLMFQFDPKLLSGCK